MSVAKPGLIYRPTEPSRYARAMEMQRTYGLPSIDVFVLAACLLDQVINGFEIEPMMPPDLERLGQKALATAS